jgi:predicted RNA binding protein YcfA (HicA-like mRNA interferase family)
VPPKIRELIADLEGAGFVNDGGKGSHRNFRHPHAKIRATLSGKPGDDAKPYQIKLVAAVIKEVKQ